MVRKDEINEHDPGGSLSIAALLAQLSAHDEGGEDMNRRRFFGALTLAPIVAVTPAMGAIPKPGGRRISVVQGDPGERLYAECCADGRPITVFRDGIEEEWTETADEAEGFVDRAVITEEGNFAINCVRGEVIIERVYGDVRIEIGEPRTGASDVACKRDGTRWTRLPRSRRRRAA